MMLLERSYNVAVKEVNGYVHIDAYFNDNNHEMKVEMLVDPETMAIKEITSEMIRVPYDVCRKALDRMDSLVGLEVKAGINKQVLTLMGGEKGCVHLIDLLRQCFNGAIQGAIKIRLRETTSEHKRTKLEKSLNGSCVRFSKN